MDFSKYIGKPLGEMAGISGAFGRIIHVFLLEDENDTVGKRFMDVYAVRQVVSAYPAMVNAIVAEAYDFFGETILRVRP